MCEVVPIVFRGSGKRLGSKFEHADDSGGGMSILESGVSGQAIRALSGGLGMEDGEVHGVRNEEGHAGHKNPGDCAVEMRNVGEGVFPDSCVSLSARSCITLGDGVDDVDAKGGDESDFHWDDDGPSGVGNVDD